MDFLEDELLPIWRRILKEESVEVKEPAIGYCITQYWLLEKGLLPDMRGTSYNNPYLLNVLHLMAIEESNHYKETRENNQKASGQPLSESKAKELHARYRKLHPKEK